MKTPPLAPETCIKALALHREGYTYKEISEKLGLSLYRASVARARGMAMERRARKYKLITVDEYEAIQPYLDAYRASRAASSTPGSLGTHSASG